jgi:hypothetical protein
MGWTIHAWHVASELLQVSRLHKKTEREHETVK